MPLRGSSGRSTLCLAFFAAACIAHVPFRAWLHEGVLPSQKQASAARSGRRNAITLSLAAAAGAASPAEPSYAEGFFGVNLDPPAPADAASPPADAEVSPSGLKSKMLLRPTCALSKYTPPEVVAKCPKPTASDKVALDFTGWQVSSGNMFASSRLERTVLKMEELFPGWQEGVKLMSPGETRRIWIPSNLAFGEEPTGTRPAGDLVMDVQLYDIVRAPN